MTEIEREYTFLAASLPAEIAGVTPMRLVDVYIPGEVADHPHTRLRQKGDKYEITQKMPATDGDASVQIEKTVPLDVIEFANLATFSGGLRVAKDRYVVTIGGYRAEVDVFQEDLQGLVLIDFEFETAEAQQAFEVPRSCGADVTQEAFIAGGMLAGKSYADIAGELARYNYTPIA